MVQFTVDSIGSSHRLLQCIDGERLMHCWKTLPTHMGGHGFPALFFTRPAVNTGATHSEKDSVQNHPNPFNSKEFGSASLQIKRNYY